MFSHMCVQRVIELVIMGGFSAVLFWLFVGVIAEASAPSRRKCCTGARETGTPETEKTGQLDQVVPLFSASSEMALLISFCRWSPFPEEAIAQVVALAQNPNLDDMSSPQEAAEWLFKQGTPAEIPGDAFRSQMYRVQYISGTAMST
eukprot:GHVT01079305.1.p1 GENE.GHVT01079305.1~~GHVT01079305.1.p1  ORF type:complete len:147 (-),score=16.58 GHVT01079305.1:114-554(-)